MDYYNTGEMDDPYVKYHMDVSLDVAISIYDGEGYDFTGGALYFHSFPNPSDWHYHNDFTQVYVKGTEEFWFYK